MLEVRRLEKVYTAGLLSRRPTFPQTISARELFAEEPGTGRAPDPRTPGRWSAWLAREEDLTR